MVKDLIDPPPTYPIKVEYKENGCHCRSAAGHEREGLHSGSHCHEGTAVPGWARDKFACSRGWENKDSGSQFQSRYPMLAYSRQIDIASAVADFYLLEAIAYDVANPRPHPVADVTNLNFDTKDNQKLLKLIGISGPKTSAAYTEKHKGQSDAGTILAAQYRPFGPYMADEVPINASLEEVKAKATLVFQEGTEILAAVFRDYMHYAAVSELSYHRHFVSTFDSDVGVYSAAIGWMEMVRQLGGARAARYASELFRDKKINNKKAWGTSYGGEKWATSTDVLSFFEDGRMGNKPFDAKLFCDRMFSLQHNTGSILNKVSWAMNGRGYKSGYHLGNLVSLLDAHHNSDWYKLSLACSLPVLSLLREYWTVTNREFIRAGLEPIAFPTSSPVYQKGSINAPNGNIVIEQPSESNKANVVIMGSDNKIDKFLIPKDKLNVGKAIVNSKGVKVKC